MILAIDVGNTNVVIGYISDSKIVSVSRMSTDISRTEKEYAILLQQLFEFDEIDYTKFEGAIISSVVPPLTEVLHSAIKLITGIDSLIIGAGIKTGLNILTDNPAQLGSDMVVGAVAALSQYKAPLIIIDMGTATTISVIDSLSRFCGCVIIPGLRLSLNALVSGTSQLPKISIDAPKNCIGTNTVDCMKSGTIFGTASMLDGMIERIESELGTAATVVATGGLAGRVTPYCKRDIIYDSELLLRGLEVIFKKNQKK